MSGRKAPGVRKTDQGRWRAQVKVGRVVVATKTFDTQREAIDWRDRERAALAGGVDPRAGKRTVAKLFPEWLEVREHAVARKTFIADSALPRLTPKSLSALQVNKVTDREVSRVLIALTRANLAESSVSRYRQSLSAFFAWAVKERMILTNPVTGTKVPKSKQVRAEMRPFTETELEEFVAAVRQPAPRDSYSMIRATERADDLDRLADILLVAGWTGLRWSELREARVSDFVRVPMPSLIVRRAAPEGVEVKGTKSGRGRVVPIADRVLPIVEALAFGRAPNDLLFVTQRGARLHQSAVKRAVDWHLIAGGRRIHDLRHTAACLWLTLGVDVTTVQAWMGHATLSTTMIYIHYLGTTADRAGLDRLNASMKGPGCAGGAPEGTTAE